MGVRGTARTGARRWAWPPQRWPHRVSFAGAWVQDEGAALVILKARHSAGGAVYDSHGQSGNFPEAGRSRQDQRNLYAEYALSRDPTAAGNFYFSTVGYRNDGRYGDRHTTGRADQEIGLR